MAGFYGLIAEAVEQMRKFGMSEALIASCVLDIAEAARSQSDVLTRETVENAIGSIGR